MVTNPPEELKPSYAALQGQANKSQVVFRVHTEHSASPLYWTGRAETSGFCSPNRHLALLTPGAYAAALEPLPWDAHTHAAEPARAPSPPALIPLDVEMTGASSEHPSAAKSAAKSSAPPERVVGVPWLAFERDPSIRQSLVDHCTRRTRPSNNWDWNGPDMAADDYSSWISTTSNLRWAVWEAAHRLLLDEASVDIAVVGVVPAPAPPPGTQFRAKASQNIRAGASGEVTLAPFQPLCEHKQYGTGTGARGRMTNSEKEAVQNAIYMARTSDEVLFYGRIFTSSVKANLTFTKDHLPLTLPPAFFSGSSERWIDDLVWDPREHSYDAANSLIQANGGGGAGYAGKPLAAHPTGSSTAVSSQHAQPSPSRTQMWASAQESGGWGAPPYAQPHQPHQPAPPLDENAWPTPSGSTSASPSKPAQPAQNSQPRTYASTSSRPANHYTSAGNSVPPSFLSSTNAVPLGRRRDFSQPQQPAAAAAPPSRRPVEW